MVVGAGITGLETAEILGANNKVTVVEMGTAVGEPLYPSVKRYLLSVLAEQGTEIKTMEAITEIKDGKAILRNSVSAFKTELDADYVVFAAGVRPNNELAEEFFANFDKVTKVGDASVPGLIGDALREANAKAWVF